MQIYRARIFTPVSDPFAGAVSSSYRSYDDGYLAVDGERIAGVGPWSDRPRDGAVTEFGSDTLLTPGFVDTHLHAPQLEMIGSYGGHLLEWLNRYTFPTEGKFSDAGHATMTAPVASDRSAAATVIWFAVTPRAASQLVAGRNSA